MKAVCHKVRRRHTHPLKPAHNRHASLPWPRAWPALAVFAILVALVVNQTRTTTGTANAGSDLTAQNLALAAANDIIIESSEATHSLRSENSNISANVGVAFGVGKNSAGFSVFADVSMGEGHENGDATVNTNSRLTAADTLAITSGRDTTIAGATLTGDKVALDIGRDLNLISRQDTATYDAAQRQISGSGEGGSGGGGGSLSYSRSETEASYASVVEQIGIYAGKGGFDINVGNNTNLTGAVIASEADAALNRLSTQTLTFTDIRNHSEYDSKSISINISAGSGGGSVSGGMSHQSDSETGATRSAIAEGDITVRGDYDASGNRIADSLAGLSRNTANANGNVENIFNPQKLAEQQEMGQLLGEVGFRAAGDIGKYFTDKKVGNEALAQQLEKEGRVDEAAALRAENQKIDSIWGEGGVAKIAMHTLVGALQADAGGGDMLSGALGAAAAETVRGIHLTDDVLGIKRDGKGNKTGLAKGIEQLVSTGIGLGAGAIAGDAMTGGGVAWDAEKFNRQLHKDEKEELKRRAAMLDLEGNPMKDANGEIIVDSDRYNKLLLAAYAIVHYGDEMNPDVAYQDVAQAMRLEGMFTDEFRSHLSFELAKGGNLESAFESYWKDPYTKEYTELKNDRTETFLRYDKYDAMADAWASKNGTNYAATTKDMEQAANKERAGKTSGVLGLDAGAGRLDAEIALGRYYQELEGGYYDLQSGFDFSKQSVAWLADQKSRPTTTNIEGQTNIHDIYNKDGSGKVGETPYKTFIQWKTFAGMDAPEKTAAEMFELNRATYAANGAEGVAQSMQILRMKDTFYTMFNTAVNIELAAADAPALVAGLANTFARNTAKTGLEAAGSGLPAGTIYNPGSNGVVLVGEGSLESASVVRQGEFVNRVFDSRYGIVSDVSGPLGRSFSPGSGVPTTALEAIEQRGLMIYNTNNAERAIIYKATENIPVTTRTSLGGTAPEVLIDPKYWESLKPVLEIKVPKL